VETETINYVLNWFEFSLLPVVARNEIIPISHLPHLKTKDELQTSPSVRLDHTRLSVFLLPFWVPSNLKKC
jgi:hypothetical protein